MSCEFCEDARELGDWAYGAIWRGRYARPRSAVEASLEREFALDEIEHFVYLAHHEGPVGTEDTDAPQK